MFRRPAFADRRRVRPARCFDRLEQLEAKSMISESLSVLMAGAMPRAMPATPLEVWTDPKRDGEGPAQARKVEHADQAASDWLTLTETPEPAGQSTLPGPGVLTETEGRGEITPLLLQSPPPFDVGTGIATISITTDVATGDQLLVSSSGGSGGEVTIEVWFKPLGFPGVTGHHMEIYVHESGGGEFHVGGGPAGSLVPPFFGNIKVDYDNDFSDKDREPYEFHTVMASGGGMDFDMVVQAITDRADHITGLMIDYHLLGPNSNSVTAFILAELIEDGYPIDSDKWNNMTDHNIYQDSGGAHYGTPGADQWDVFK